MKVCRTKREVRAEVKAAMADGAAVGLVPTMGALHDGHMSLIERSIADNDFTVVSVFVNPTQFGPAEDLDKYPAQLERDVAMCEEAGVGVVFAPDAAEMYEDGFSTYVEETKLSAHLCGAKRPEHFRGVTTVVAKLLNIVRPNRVYFGQKDGQQIAVIRRMVADLDMDVDVVVMPIVRESDGLAMSSRNTYLTGDLRQEALVLSKALGEARESFSSGETDTAKLKSLMQSVIEKAPHAKIDYIEIVDADTLEPLAELNTRAMAALAVFIGDTRLIDNAVFEPESKGGDLNCAR